MHRKISNQKMVLSLLVCVFFCCAILGGCQNNTNAPTTSTQSSQQNSSQSPSSEPYPTKPIRLIVQTDPGGGVDTNVRKLQPFLERELGVPIVVDNRPGAAGLLGPKMLTESEGDGYTIGSAGSPNTELGVLTMDVFDINKLCGLARMAQDVAVIMVRDDAPWQTFEELLEDARNRPGEITVSVSAVVGDNFLGMRMIEDAAEVDFNIVAFSGGAPSRNALAGGHVDITHTSLFSARSLWDNCRILAVHWETNDIPEFTDNAPTVVSTLPNIGKVNCGTSNILVAPSSLKEQYPDRYEILVKAIEKTFNDPEFLETIKGEDEYAYLSASDLDAYMADNLESFSNYLAYFDEDVETRE